MIAWSVHGALQDWTRYPGTAPGADGSFNLVLFGAAASVVFSLIAQVGEQVDYLRFLPPRRPDRRRPGAGGRRCWPAVPAGS